MKKSLAVLVVLVLVFILSSGGEALFLMTKEEAASGAAKKGANIEVQTKTASASFPMQTFMLNYANAKDMSASFNEILGNGEVVAVNEKLNAIIVRASDKTIKRMAESIKKLDKAPLQVQVEAKIIELKSGSGDTANPSVMGASWKYTKNSNNSVQLLTDTSTAAASSLGLYAQLLSGNTQAYLEAMEKTVGYDLVASPWITALNNEPASILIGQKIGYLTTFTSSTGTAQNISFLEVGTKLNFTPHISDDGFIVMDIYPSVSDGSLSSTGVPTENTTETRNKVLVKDGQSIVIGGLTKNYNSEVEIGVPGLASIPFIGMLFRRTELTTEKREIMVLITPHIVTPEYLTSMAQKAEELDNKRAEWVKKKAKLVH
ncbi:MAG: secretin N-terminal domain-containing protein [bacterium]